MAYTASNVCMRQLASLECDPFLAVFGRESFTSVIAGPCVLAMAIRRGGALPSGRELGQLLLAGLLLQLGGNLCGQWAMGVVGLSINVPAFFGVMMIGAAVLGRLCLGEPVSRRSTLAMAVLLVSLMLLGLGAERAGQAMAASTPHAIAITTVVLTVAVVASGVAGATSAVLGISVRHATNRGVMPIAIAFLIPLVGTFSVGPLILCRSGSQLFLDTPSEQWWFMVGAGAFNFVGFLSFILGLRRTSVVYANAISATQVAMAAVAGIALFQETPNPWLLLGVCLTIAGVLGFDRPSESGGV